ncbi:MAG: DUF6506 family protein [Christensenellales bacterium]
MKTLNFAFLVKGEGYDARVHRAYFENEYTKTHVLGVEDIAAAQEAARELVREGVELIELCGAFGQEGARSVAEALDGAVPVGYVTHDKSQKSLMDALFGSK